MKLYILIFPTVPNDLLPDTPFFDEVNQIYQVANQLLIEKIDSRDKAGVITDSTRIDLIKFDIFTLAKSFFHSKYGYFPSSSTF